MAKIRIGVDPGKKGFITILRKKGGVEFHPIPLTGGGKFYDHVELVKIFRDLDPDNNNVHAVLENVNGDPNWGTLGNFSMGGCMEMFKMLFTSLGISYTPVHAKTWQKEMHEGVKPILKPLTAAEKKRGRKNGSKDVKATSILVAKRLFPKVDWRRTNHPNCKNDDDNKVDATLIALYCKRHF